MTSRIRNAVAALLALASSAAAAELPRVVFDFEAGNFDGWSVEGDAFGPAPAASTLPTQMPVTGQLGRYANSYHGGDAARGTLTSPPFRVDRARLRLLRGGGADAERLQINLLHGDQVVRAATGVRDRPGGTEQLDWLEWDVAELRGAEVRLQIVDRAQGGWGHLTLDHVVLDDQPLPALGDVLVPVRGAGRYVHLPIANDAPTRRVEVLADGRPVRPFEAQLSSQPDFWVSLPVDEFGDATLALRVADARAVDVPFAALERSDAHRDAAQDYREPLRPQFHFTARRGWINDPNGLVWADGAWHLYFQHNPFGWASAQKHWGHAVSTDLLHWREVGTALRPPQFGDEAFSGSAVLDVDNTSGLGRAGKPPIVAAFTSTARGECVVYSNDGGATFAEIEDNPVVVHKEIGRDPRLVRDEQRGEWVMAVYRRAEDKDWVAFWTSPDLKRWAYQSDLEGFYECPDLRRLPVDGDARDARWLLYAADAQYVLGTWDGQRFAPTTGRKQRTLYGDFYAGQTFTNAPDGRTVYSAWHIGSDAPGAPFNQQLTLFLELELRRAGDEGVRLFANPIREYERLRGVPTVHENVALADGAAPTPLGRGDALDLVASFELGDARQIGLTVRGRELVYDRDRRLLTFGDVEVPLSVADGTLDLRVLVDALSVDLFAEGGYAALCERVPATPGAAAEVRAFARGGEGGARVSGAAYPMHSIRRDDEAAPAAPPP